MPQLYKKDIMLQSMPLAYNTKEVNKNMAEQTDQMVK